MAGDEDQVRLLVPINFSEKSEMALDFALAHAYALNAQIYLFHVFEGVTKNFRRLDALNEEYMERMKQAMLTALERIQTKGVTPQVEDVHRRLAYGKAATEILKMADGIAADMIIMGTPNSRPFKKFMTESPCTLVLVKRKDFT